MIHPGNILATIQTGDPRSSRCLYKRLNKKTIIIDIIKQKARTIRLV